MNDGIKHLNWLYCIIFAEISIVEYWCLYGIYSFAIPWLNHEELQKHVKKRK